MDKAQPGKDLIIAQIARWKGGIAKFGLSRGKIKDGEWIYYKLGRMTKTETFCALEMIKRAIATGLIEDNPEA
jgi:hypothetical protein